MLRSGQVGRDLACNSDQKTFRYKYANGRTAQYVGRKQLAGVVVRPHTVLWWRKPRKWTRYASSFWACLVQARGVKKVKDNDFGRRASTT